MLYSLTILKKMEISEIVLSNVLFQMAQLDIILQLNEWWSFLHFSQCVWKCFITLCLKYDFSFLLLLYTAILWKNIPILRLFFFDFMFPLFLSPHPPLSSRYGKTKNTCLIRIPASHRWWYSFRKIQTLFF